MWAKGYPTETSTFSHDHATNKILIGLDDGTIDIIQVTTNGFEDVVCFKAHLNRVTGVAFDALNNFVYSVSLDKVFRVSYGSSIALIVGIPHK
jgi:WD40 repeat protein